jgi:SH3-like domain-containing protein
MTQERNNIIALTASKDSSSTLYFVAFLLFLILISSNSFSSPKKIQEVNYFSSLRATETNVRSGPGPNYPVKFTFKLRSIPVRVISEYDNWNEIEDFEGQSGWVTQTLLTKKRTLITKISKSFTNMHSKPNEKSRVVYRLENHVVGEYLKCEKDWCAMKIEGKKGWVKKEDLFGFE